MKMKLRMKMKMTGFEKVVLNSSLTETANGPMYDGSTYSMIVGDMILL